MRILITNHGLKFRAGTELYVRDIALALQRRGHEPWCYSTVLGPVAEELRAAGVKVVGALAELPAKPDLIHGHHRLETTAAGLYFPNVPVVSYCHGPRAWQERPCRLPSVRLWVAVDEACRERLVEEEGLDPGSIRVLLNFADLSRFPQRGSLPDRPKKALVFSNSASKDTHVPVLKKVCEAAGITLEVAGLASGKVVEHPGQLLPHYDLVFAKARAAIEGMAAGCAVVQCDAFGAGRLVTPQNFDELRALNFGFKSMRYPITVEHLSAQLAGYDAGNCLMVTRRVRDECTLEAAIDRLLAIYDEALRSPQRMEEGQSDLREAAQFLEKEIPQMTAGRESVELRHELEKLRLRLERTQVQRDGAKESLAEAKVKLARYKEELSRLRAGRPWWKRWWRRGN